MHFPLTFHAPPSPVRMGALMRQTEGKFRSWQRYRSGCVAPTPASRLLANGESKEGNPMPHKATSTRDTPSTQARPSSQGKNLGLDITSQSIASDLVAFRKQGGRIEVLGNTPLRANVTAFSSKGSTQHKAAQHKAALRNTTPAQAKKSATQG